MNVDGFSALNDEHDGEHNHHVSLILPWKAAQLTQENTFDMVCYTQNSDTERLNLLENIFVTLTLGLIKHISFKN